MCIEVDGDLHAEPDQIEYDAARTGELEAEGYRVIRFANRDILRDLEGVLVTKNVGEPQKSRRRWAVPEQRRDSANAFVPRPNLPRRKTRLPSRLTRGSNATVPAQVNQRERAASLPGR